MLVFCCSGCRDLERLRLDQQYPRADENNKVMYHATPVAYDVDGHAALSYVAKLPRAAPKAAFIASWHELEQEVTLPQVGKVQ